MKYMAVLVAVLAAGFFFINYHKTVVPMEKVTIDAMTAEEKKSIEVGAGETIKYFKKYNQAPKNQVTIVTMNDKQVYEDLLVSRYKLNRDTAELVSAGRGFYTGDTIFINTKAAANDLLRIATTAHEFTHYFQNQMAPGIAGLAWLQEGMADTAACDILEQAGQAQIQPLPVKQLKLPAELSLANLKTDEDWIDAVNEYGANTVYAYSALAARRLISQKGFLCCINFYQELNRTHNIETSFKTAFGMELSEYQEKFSEYMKNDKDSIYYYNYYR
ncbi:MAG: hypothetical protein LLG02_01735 [Pelosinus sp.]|nr:hypothetical protein [Pelosinus sp.]